LKNINYLYVLGRKENPEDIVNLATRLTGSSAGLCAEYVGLFICTSINIWLSFHLLWYLFFYFIFMDVFQFLISISV